MDNKIKKIQPSAAEENNAQMTVGNVSLALYPIIPVEIKIQEIAIALENR